MNDCLRNGRCAKCIVRLPSHPAAASGPSPGFGACRPAAGRCLESSFLVNHWSLSLERKSAWTCFRMQPKKQTSLPSAFPPAPSLAPSFFYHCAWACKQTDRQSPGRLYDQPAKHHARRWRTCSKAKVCTRRGRGGEWRKQRCLHQKGIGCNYKLLRRVKLIKFATQPFVSSTLRRSEPCAERKWRYRHVTDILGGTHRHRQLMGTKAPPWGLRDTRMVCSLILYWTYKSLVKAPLPNKSLI